MWKVIKQVLSVAVIMMVLLASIQLGNVNSVASAQEEGSSDLEEAEDRFYRAFWVQAFAPGLKTPEEIDQLVADVKTANMNAIVAQVVRRHDAYFQSEYLPFTEDPTVAEGFDPLGYLISKAKEQGIEVHAWVVLGPMWHPIYGGTPQDPNHIYNKYGPHASEDETWVTKGYDGSVGNVMQPYADFGHPDVVNHFVNMTKDIVQNYDVDGIHLDYVRYPENPGGRPYGWYGYNPTSLTRFQEETDRTDIPEPSDPEWLDWKVKQVDLAMKRIYLEVTSIDIDTVVSAAVLSWGFDDPRSTDWWDMDPVQRTHQDWKKWVQEGYLDYTFVMNYDPDANPIRAARYDAWIEWQKDLPRNRGMIIGPALYQNAIPDSISQINRALVPSPSGNIAEGISPYVYNVWSNDSSPREDLIRSLIEPTEWNGGVAPFAEPVSVPDHPWKQEPYGHVLGRLVNQDGEALSNADLVIRRGVNGPVIKEAVTDSNGYFGVTDLQPGNYFVSSSVGSQDQSTLQVKPREVAQITVTVE